jgi:hypothetical protein
MASNSNLATLTSFKPEMQSSWPTRGITAESTVACCGKDLQSVVWAWEQLILEAILRQALEYPMIVLIYIKIYTL